MKTQLLGLGFGIGGLFIAASTAEATFVEVHLALHTTTSPSATGGIARDVYRVYALFNDPGDTLTTIYGTPDSPFTVNLHGATPFNPPAGGNVPGNNYAVSSVPATQWDSYVTIGLAAGYVGDPGANLILSPGFPNFITAGGIAPQDNFAWTTPGPLPQGLAGNGVAFGNLWGVLIMQISVNAGSPSPSGTLGLAYTTSAGSSVNVNNVNWPIPAPGGLALLGVAGLAGTRRRRA